MTFDIDNIEWEVFREDESKTEFVYNELFGYLKELKSLVKDSRNKAQILLTILSSIASFVYS